MIDLDRPDFIIDGKEYLKGVRSIIYGWKRRGDWLYIGMSTIGLYRLYAHNTLNVVEPILDIDEFFIWYVDKDKLFDLEKELIQTLKPEHNKTIRKEVDSACVCPRCNKIFYNKRGWQIFCSEKCRNKRMMEVKGQLKICIQCNKELPDNKPNQLYCNLVCKNKFRENKMKQILLEKSYTIK